MALRTMISLLLVSLALVSKSASSEDDEYLLENFALQAKARPPATTLKPPAISVPTVKPPAAPVPIIVPPVPPTPIIKPPVAAPNPPARTTKVCNSQCTNRCSLHSRKGLCMRACLTCCDRCKCVPPGTYGNREMCGKCYTDMRTHRNRPKCP